MYFMKKICLRNIIVVLSLLIINNTSQALECNSTPCACSSTIGIGYVQATDGVAPYYTFQLAVPHSGGGFSSYYRDNNIVDPAHVSGRTWYGPSTVSSGNINGIMMLENAKTNPANTQTPIPGLGNLEVMLVRDGSLYHYWRDRKTLAWSSGTLVASGVSGQPGFTQSKNYHQNFEVVVPLVGGGLAHYWRDNTDPAMPWHGPNVFAQGKTFESVSLIESNFSVGRLEVIARSGYTLWHMWREDNLVWTNPLELRVDVANGGTSLISATGVHAFIQGKAGTQGDFELIVPLTTGGLIHYSRNNDFKDPYYHWKVVGWVDPIQSNMYTSAGVILSSFGNLEVVGRRGLDGALVSFHSNNNGDKSTYDYWTPVANNTGTPNWAGTVFGGEPCSYAVTGGRWLDPFNAKSIGIHAALLPTSGKVLFFGFGDDSDMGYSEIFDPKNGTGVEPFGVMPHAFCSGHTHMSDGRLWVAGGHGEDHVKDSHIFDPFFSLWDKPANLQFQTGRWYPTLTRLESGAILAVSGAKELGRLADNTEVNRYVQILNKTGTTLSPEDASKMVPDPFSITSPAADKNFLQLYPFVFQLPTGGVFIHSYRTSRFFTPETNVWTSQEIQTKSPYSRTYPGYGSAVMLPLSPSDNYTARIMLFGGGGNVSNQDKSQESDVNVPADKTVEMLDLGAASPQWVNKAPMSVPRVLDHAVLLPDGKVLVVGGSTFGSADNAVVPIMSPEMYDPSKDIWTKMTPMRVPRLYHASALLLPDARVIVAGRDHAFNAFPYVWPERRVEIFSPPYLESGNPRPVIWWTNVDSIGFNQSLTVNVNTTNAVSPYNISRAVLIAPGSETHGFDMGQRAINLTITNKTSTALTVTTPPNGKVAPPGYYMLFLVSDAGVPSVASWIQVGR